jgi:catechol 2,3-dioxygenase-like lactoylglutathione lyase family enzyme
MQIKLHSHQLRDPGFGTALVVALLVGQSYSQAAAAKAGQPVARPPIIGVAHIGLRTADMAAARSFYGGILGLQEASDKPAAGAGELKIACFRANDHQYVELFPELSDPKMDRLTDIAFETKDAEHLRVYMASKGVKVPGVLEPTQDGNRGFKVQDPDGHVVEFVEVQPGSLHSKDFGKSSQDSRISQRIIHVGVVVNDRAAADHFYKDILGFTEIWHGGMTDTETDWVDMRVPDGTDWLEYMLNVHNPDVRLLGVMHHLALGVADVKSGFELAIKRGYRSTEKPQIGRDGKWQFNLYDPDFTRVELMEPKPVQTPCCSPMRQ